MSYQLGWLIDQRVMLLEFGEQITANDVLQSNEAMTELLTQGQAPLYLVVNAYQTRTYPMNLTTFFQPRIRAALDAIKHTYIRRGIVNERVGVPIINAVIQWAKMPMTFVATVDEAVALIQAADPTVKGE
jgi:hypothetical protein